MRCSARRPHHDGLFATVLYARPDIPAASMVVPLLTIRTVSPIPMQNMMVAQSTIWKVCGRFAGGRQRAGSARSQQGMPFRRRAVSGGQTRSV